LLSLQRGGIDPASVFFISYGVEIGNTSVDRGVIEKFTMFSGEEMLEKAKYVMREEVTNLPHSKEANINGYITGMISGNIK
jgi:hypothetical protein